MLVNSENIVCSQQAHDDPEKPMYPVMRTVEDGQAEKHDSIIRYEDVEYLGIAEMAPLKYRLLLHKPILVLRSR